MCVCLFYRIYNPNVFLPDGSIRLGQYGEYLCFSAAHCAPSKSHRKKQQKCKQFAFASIVILDYFINSEILQICLLFGQCCV